MKVFITGASSGIGAALAEHYAHQGATLGLVARREDILKELAARLPSSAVYYAVDVRDAAAMNDAAQDFIRRYGAPEVVIANAGVSCGTLTENTEDNKAFQAIFDINVIGMANTFQPFISEMRSQKKKGCLVGIASVAGIRGLPGAGAYSASKAAAIAYLESLRIEMGAYGIHVTTIAPGFIRTPMTAINPYPMPFLMDVNKASEKMVAAITNKKSFVVVPWQMNIVALIMRLIPNFIWDRLFKNVPQKPHVKWDWL